MDMCSPPVNRAKPNQKYREKAPERGDLFVDRIRPPSFMAAGGGSLSQAQIDEYRTVFAFHDRENKGSLDRATAVSLMRSLGEDPSDSDLQSLCPGGNMTLDSLLANRTQKWARVQDRQSVLRAFAVFDSQKSGKVPADYLKHALVHLGNMPASEADALINDAQPSGGWIDYNAFVSKLLTGAG